MENSNKVLKVVFFVLLLVVVGELFYFFYYSRKKSLNRPLSTDVLITNTPTQAEGFVPKEFVDYLSSRKKVDGYKLYFEEEKTGVVSDLNFDKYDKNNISFVGSFVISNDKGEEVQKFAMTKKRLETMKFYQIIDDKKILFDFFNLKLNQKIKYVYKTDLTADYDPKIKPDGDVVISEFIVD